MSLDHQLAAELVRLDRAIDGLARPAGDPRELRLLAGQLVERAQATRAAGVRAASLPRAMDFTGPGAARYAAHATQCGTVSLAAADRLIALSDDLLGQASTLQSRLDEHGADLKRLSAQRDVVAAQLKGRS